VQGTLRTTIAVTAAAGLVAGVASAATAPTPKKGKWRGTTHKVNPLNGKRGKIAFRVVQGQHLRRVKNPRVWGIPAPCGGGRSYSFKAEVVNTFPVKNGKWHMKRALKQDANVASGTLKVNGTFTSSTKGHGTIRVNFKTHDGKFCSSGPLSFDKGYLSP
jgi:hypothetical protein